MGPFDDWEPKYLPDGTHGTCVFCRRPGPLAYYTVLGMPVGVCCKR